MKSISLFVLAILMSSASYAGVIEVTDYRLTAINGNFSYGRTDWNANFEFGVLNNISDLSEVETLLSDGYTELSGSATGKTNSIYSSFQLNDFHSLEFSLMDDYILESFSFLSSRSYNDLTALSLEYSLGGDAWQSAISTTSGVLSRRKKLQTFTSTIYNAPIPIRGLLPNENT